MTATLTRRVVGQPIHESLVTSAVARSASGLFAPGTGRTLYSACEVDLGIGRPDHVFVAVSPGTLSARASHEIRFDSLTEARVLAEELGFERSGCSAAHAQSVRLRLRRRGLLSPVVTQMLLRTELESLIVEAKVTDWKSGLRQLNRTSWLTHRSAIAMPSPFLGRVSESFTAANRIGLIEVDTVEGNAEWRQHAPRSAIPLSARLWLAEIALREALAV